MYIERKRDFEIIDLSLTGADNIFFLLRLNRPAEKLCEHDTRTSKTGFTFEVISEFTQCFHEIIMSNF